MSVNHVISRNAPAAGNYADSIGLIVYETDANEVTLAPNATVRPLGIIVEAEDSLAGRVSVCTSGYCKAKVNGVLTLGTNLWCQADAGGSGEAVAMANDGYAVGYLLATVDTVADEMVDFYVDIQSDIFGVANNAADIATNTADIATNTGDIATNTAAIAALPTTQAGELAAGVTGGAVSWTVTMGAAMPSTDYAVSIIYVSGFNGGGTAPTAVGTWQVTVSSTTQFVVEYVDNTDAALTIDDLTFRWIAVSY